MPSLEIICIGQFEQIDFSDVPFRVEVEKELKSHRVPKPLFQADFDKLEGCIYHLLDQSSPTAFDLLKRNWYDTTGNSNGQDENVEFRDEYASAVKEMLKQLLLSSPVGQVLFTTDYQFGPESVEKYGPLSLTDFWLLHDAGEVRMNASYAIHSNLG